MSAQSDPLAHEERIVCEHADRCGGCPIIGLSYPEQLALKRGRVVQSTARYPSLEFVHTEPVAPAEPLVGYRTRAKLIVAPGGKVGLFARGGGHQVIDIPRCRVLAPVLLRIAANLRARIAEAEARGGVLAPCDPSGRGWLRALDLREVRDGNTERVLITFVLERARVTDLGSLQEAAEALMLSVPEVIGVAANFHEGEAPQILGGETVTLAGVDSAPDRLGASTHFATFGSFVQAHRGQAGRVHALLAAAIGVPRYDGSTPRVLDLYGGSGAIALGLAAAGASVRLVESFAPAVAQAREAAIAQELDVEPLCAGVAAALRGMCERAERFDAAIVNPPRRGTSPATREHLARLDVPLIAYVACDPETLARDLDHFALLGYGTTSLQPLDMIPLTDEVETVAILHRIVVPLPRVVYEDSEVFIVDKDAHEPTTPQIEYAGSLLARARRLPGAGSALPVHRLDVGTSGLLLFVRQPAYVEKWARLLSAPGTRKIYLACVRGVTPAKGCISRDLREEGKLHRARTRYRRLAIAAGHSVLRIVPEQDHTHQIRRHFAGLGHPILGDDRYGHPQTNRYFEEKSGLDRTFLHCVRFEFEHPDTGHRHIVEAPLPGNLRAVLERTSGPGTLRFLDNKGALGTSRTSSLPPGPEEFVHDRGSALDIDTRSPSLPPEIVADDDGHTGGEF
jgi:23S rRNA (uracil1939-C5)-methyltransferase